MDLKLGTWELVVNGIKGSLLLKSVNDKGIVDGTVENNFQIQGFWDNASRIISFSPVFEFGDTPFYYPLYFKGWLFDFPSKSEINPGQDIEWYLTGFCQFSGPFSNVEVVEPLTKSLLSQSNFKKNSFGWFAKTNEFV